MARTYEEITSAMIDLETCGLPYEEVAEEYEALSKERDQIKTNKKMSASLKRHIKAINSSQHRDTE